MDVLKRNKFYIYNKKGKTIFNIDEVNNVVDILDIDYSNPTKAIEKLMSIHPLWKQGPESEEFKKFITTDTFVDHEDLINLANFFKRIGSVIEARRALEYALEVAMEKENIECCDPSVDLGDLRLLDAQGKEVKVGPKNFSDYKAYLDFIYEQSYKFAEFCEQLGDMYEYMAYQYDEYLADQD